MELNLPEAAMCRVCWSEGDLPEQGKLVAPCSCSGSMGHIHEQCLSSWRQERQTQGRATDVCELCGTPYRLPAFSSRRTPAQLLLSLQSALGSPPSTGLFWHAFSAWSCCHKVRRLAVRSAAGYRWGDTSGRSFAAHPRVVSVCTALRALDDVVDKKREIELPLLTLVRSVVLLPLLSPGAVGVLVGVLCGAWEAGAALRSFHKHREGVMLLRRRVSDRTARVVSAAVVVAHTAVLRRPLLGVLRGAARLVARIGGRR